jgi:predicted RNA-binding protein Jag
MFIWVLKQNPHFFYGNDNLGSATCMSYDTQYKFTERLAHTNSENRLQLSSNKTNKLIGKDAKNFNSLQRRLPVKYQKLAKKIIT